MATTENQSALEGFTPITDQIYIRESVTSPPPPSDPETILLFGWGDAQPKHVSKYIAGYRALFPSSRIVLIFSPILRALLSDLPTRTAHMSPVIDALSPPRLDSEKQSPRILAHVMSNTGGINYAATLNAHRARHALPLPHDLVVLDSTPGSTDFFPNITRWSRAMAIGASKSLPFLPFALAQALAASFLSVMHATSWLVGRVSAADFSVDAVNSPELADLDTRRLYLYSREDDIIHWEDIEKHAARAVEAGYGVDVHVFEGTPHVGHMRAYPEQYWADIKASWEKVCKGDW